ncbi:MAG: DUF72 domain-containing protein [Desulfobacteraceae bacterium]|nr:MAG: DUF72 domain-containing protein [Desulfobacteraceae bacterium]
MERMVRVGTSGYQYTHWKNILYPEYLPKKHWFGRYCEKFDTVELNTTFYHQPKDATYENWRAAAPPDFRYAVKYNRFGTHIKRLKDGPEHLERFLSGAERLRTKLGPILVQLPPNFKKNKERLDEFLRAAPGRRRWAVEFRDPSWLDDDIYDLLHIHEAAMVIHDHIRDHPRIVTANWLYLRFHGGENNGLYSDRQLSEAADFIQDSLDRAPTAWVYFNNDLHGHAVHNALELIDRLRRRGVPAGVGQVSKNSR